MANNQHCNHGNPEGPLIFRTDDETQDYFTHYYCSQCGAFGTLCKSGEEEGGVPTWSLPRGGDKGGRWRSNMTSDRILLDMDGVLTNWVGGVARLFRKDEHQVLRSCLPGESVEGDGMDPADDILSAGNEGR